MRHQTPIHKLSSAAPVVYPWMLEVQKIRNQEISSQEGTPEASSTLYQLLEARQFRLKPSSRSTGVSLLPSHEQELSALTSAIDSELALAARSSPERLGVTQITQLLHLEQKLTARLSLGQTLAQNTIHFYDYLSAAHEILTKEKETTRSTLRPLVELIATEARLTTKTASSVDTCYWMLADLTSLVPDLSSSSRPLLRPLLNMLRMIGRLDDPLILDRDDLLLAVILADLPLIGLTMKASKKAIPDQLLESRVKLHAQAAVGIATGISDLPSHLVGLIANHHAPLPSASPLAIPMGKLQQTLNSFVTLGEVFAAHQARLSMSDYALSSEPSRLQILDQTIQQAVVSGQIDEGAVRLVTKSLEWQEVLGSLQSISSAPLTEQQKLQMLLDQGNYRLDRPHQLRAPLFQVNPYQVKQKVAARKRRLTSYPGPRKRV